ncbi:MAG: hypothetical protein KDC87_06855 [Planctomycetes bacterium]|nr:hypothetical protein [Planctomycetota bacterium]MCB9869629.1 hypothetical protein [Planctomycetota bacterium]
MNSEFVRIDVARTPFEAQVVAGVLRSAGIPVLINGSLCQDDFAISQALLNRVGTDVRVPPDRVEDALAAIAQARSEAAEPRELPESDATPPDPPSPVRRTRWGLGWLIAAVFFVLWMVYFSLWSGLEQQLREQEEGSPFRTVWDGDERTLIWRETGNVAFVYLDRNRNGNDECVKGYNRAGQLLFTHWDRNENGVFELVQQYDRNGTRILEHHDDDEDGFFDRVIRFHPDGRQSRWTDEDRDGYPEFLSEFEPDGTQQVGKPQKK